MNYDKIKILSEEKNLAIKNLAQKIGITEAGLHQMVRNKSIKVDILENIASILDVPVSYFFEEGVTGGSGVEKNLNHSQINYQQGDGNKNAQHVGDGCVECGRLQEKLAAAHREIALLQKVVAMYEKGAEK